VVGLIVAGLAGIPVSAKADEAPAAPRKLDFSREIRPILANHCWSCHGPDEKHRKAGLRLDLADGSRAKLESGLAAIVPGKSDESELVARIESPDETEIMPPPAPKKPLTADQMKLLRLWIDQGAEYARHWAYTPPKRPALPHVKDSAWPRNRIDLFVLSRLEEAGLTPAPEADKGTLLRRVTLDLTGLPPTLKELDNFLADQSTDAYEKVVDRLLDSPRYGERWGRHWLDLARYADTNGYEKDKRRDIWKYRDWVIDALNADMPFDRFTVEQIAGDMLPDATEAQRIATGFHRNAMTNEEGGVDPDESMYEVLVDRVNTTATVWLGTTLGCAQCHNHKYDPFSQKDYFRLLAFFANPAYEKEVSGDGTRYHEAKLDLASPEQAAKRTAAQGEVKRLEGVLAETTPELAERQRAWEAGIRDAERAWMVLAPRDATATNGVRLATQPDGSILASGPNAELTTYTAAPTNLTTSVTNSTPAVIADSAVDLFSAPAL
jgi:cytochrome c553